MANASVEKLKALGLRQGEKVVVGIAGLAFLACLGLSLTKETIETTPEVLQKKAEAADSNLNRKQDVEQIKERIEEAGIKDPGFVQIVEGQAAHALKPGDYRGRLDWVTPEPGAGLIRDQPEVVTPTELAAFPGRGGILLWSLDEKGEKIPLKVEGGVAAGPGGRPGAGGGRPPAEKSEEQKKRAELERQRKINLLAGNAAAGKDAEKPDAAAAAPNPAAEGPFKEDTFGKRWVVLTAVVNNEEMNKNWLAALKNPAIAYPQYVKADVERQTRQADESWSAWAPLDEDAKYKVLDNITEGDEEFVPPAKRPIELVDPLPNLEAGFWTGVHVARLVPPAILEAPPVAETGGGRQGQSSSMSNPGRNQGLQEGAMGMGSSSRSGSGSGRMSGGGEAGPAEEAVVANSEPTLMIRSLDFSVEPNIVYRYRVRLVVKNPNYERSDINPGVDTSSQNLTGAWSEPTGPVAVPADVSSFARAPGTDTRRNDVVQFQVFKWDPLKGQTVMKNDDAAPGHLIGEAGTVQMPSSKGGGPKSETIDFNSRSFVLDSSGGKSRIPDIGVDRTSFSIPALAMVVEPDGAVVVRSQALDSLDEVRLDMSANYDQAIKESGTKRSKKAGSRKPGQGGRSGPQTSSGGGRSSGP